MRRGPRSPAAIPPSDQRQKDIEIKKFLGITLALSLLVSGAAVVAYNGDTGNHSPIGNSTDGSDILDANAGTADVEGKPVAESIGTPAPTDGEHEGPGRPVGGFGPALPPIPTGPTHYGCVTDVHGTVCTDLPAPTTAPDDGDEPVELTNEGSELQIPVVLIELAG